MLSLMLARCHYGMTGLHIVSEPNPRAWRGYVWITALSGTAYIGCASHIECSSTLIHII